MRPHKRLEQPFWSQTSKVSLFHFDEYDMWVPPVTIIFLTYATSSIRTVWSGDNETVFLSALVKKSKGKKNKAKTIKF